MLATGAARKRGKPASGAGAGAGAGKRRRKVSMALWQAGVYPSYWDHPNPIRGSRPRDPGWSQLRPFLRASNPEKPFT